MQSAAVHRAGCSHSVPLPQEVHWRQAQEGLLPDEAEPEEQLEGAALIETPQDAWQERASAAAEQQRTWPAERAAQSAAMYPSDTSAGLYANAAWGSSSAATPWADWAALEGPGRAAASRQAASGAHAYGTAENVGASGSAAGQWSPEELAAQARAWSEWAAWQAQSSAQGSAQPADQSQAAPTAEVQQGSAQSVLKPVPAEAETVCIPISTYRRYQELEWAEWQRQYERWQQQYESWYACYEHWYSSYLAWYNLHGASSTQYAEQ